MKTMLTALTLSLTLLGQHQVSASDAENIELFHKIVKDNQYTLTIDGDKASGDGVDWLVEKGSKAQYFLVGERHGLAEIPVISAEIFKGLADKGYTHAALEVGPFGAYTLEEQLKSGGYQQLEQFLTSKVGENAIAFLGWKEEAIMVAKLFQYSKNKTNFFIGPDQEFVLGYASFLDFLERKASTKEQIALVNAHKQKLKNDHFAFASANPKEFDSLKQAFSQHTNSRVRQLVSDMAKSNYIYGGFSNPQRIYRAKSNSVREELMKDNFLAAMRAEKKRLGYEPKVFFKFGGFHSGTQVDYGLGRITFGTFVEAYAKVVGGHKFNVFMECSSGSRQSSGQDSDKTQVGKKKSCQSYFGTMDSSDITKKENHPFAQYLNSSDKVIVFDLKPIREALEKFRFLDRDFRELVTSFDAYIAIPGARSSQKYTDFPKG